MPPKSKPSTAAAVSRRAPRATAKKPTSNVSAKSTAAETSSETPPAVAVAVAVAATPEPAVSLTTPKIETTSRTSTTTTSKSTATVANEGSTQVPAKTTPETSPEIMKSPVKSAGDVTESAVIATIPHIGEETMNRVALDEAIANEAIRSEIVDRGGEGSAKEASKKTTARTVVKKTVRVVKKIVKKKVPKRVLKGQSVLSNEESVEKLGMEIDGVNPNFGVLGAMEVENPKSVESVLPEVENYSPEPNHPVTLEVKNANDQVSMEVENSNSSPCVSALIEIENPCSHISVSNEIESTEATKADEGEKDAFAVSMNKGDENEKIVSVIETQLEDQNVGSIQEGDQSEKIVSVVETELEDQNVGSIRDGEESEKTICENETQLEDQNVGSIREGTEEFETENVGSGDGEDDEREKEEVENCEVGVLKGDGLVLSGEMEALERRRRRRTEIFIGGLDKDAKEEDIRKAFEDVGGIVEISLVMSGKQGKNKGFAFMRLATADDAKKALVKHSKVEICGKQCGVSLVKGNDTIFLGNIDKKWSTEDVLKLLHSIGIEKIDKVTVIADPSNIECNRGFAFLELETTKDAQYAYKKLQKKDVFGKNLKIKVAWAEPLNEPDEEEMLKVKSVYAEYLPSSWDEGKVRNYFEKFGEIENVVLAQNLRSSKRKDFAFVTYATREAALACIDAFNRESLINDGSKVNVKVSLAKPVPKVKQIKQTSNPTSKESSQVKLKAAQPVIRPYVALNKGHSSLSNYENVRVHQKSSTTAELVGLLREQASWRQPQMGSGSGSLDMDHPYPAPGMKRPFSTLRDDPLYSDPRRYHPRARLESSFPVASPSGLSQGTGTISLPYNHRQGAGYSSRSLNGVEDYPNNIQTRSAPYHGNSGLYRRY